MNCFAKSFAKGSLLLFGLFVLTFVSVFKSHSQVRLAGLAGISYGKDNHYVKFTGVLNAGYEYKHVSILYDQRHQVFTGGSWFGGNAGYAFQTQNLTIRPYAGFWYKTVGNKSKTDRYVQDGNEKIISSAKAVNTTTGGYGLQIFRGKYMFDIGYHGVYSLTIGLGGLLD